MREYTGSASSARLAQSRCPRDGFFRRPFRKRFGGRHYNAPFPPPAEFANHPSTADFTDFIRGEITKGLRSGGIQYVGPVGSSSVLPLGIEPNKPRLIYDARNLNLWCHHVPFSFDHLADAPRIVRSDGTIASALSRLPPEHEYMISRCMWLRL